MKFKKDSPPQENTGMVNGVVHPLSYGDMESTYEPRHTLGDMLKALAKKTSEEVQQLITALKSSKSHEKQDAEADEREKSNDFHNSNDPW